MVYSEHVTPYSKAIKSSRVKCVNFDRNGYASEKPNPCFRFRAAGELGTALPYEYNMTDVCTAILSVIRDIFSIAEEVRRTNNQARRLLNRLLALEDPVRRIQSDKSTPPMASLHQTKTLLENSRGFLMMYKATSKITRIMKRYFVPRGKRANRASVAQKAGTGVGLVLD